MRRSSDIVKIFADCDIKSNHTFELNFGLLQYKPLYEPLPFIIEPDETDQPVFGPSHRTLLLTQTDIMSRRLGGDIPTEPDPAARCPAIGRVMTAFWNAGVDECVSDPGLFAAGLTETLAA
ncbi:MAG TPA: hypothetical protein VNG32_04395 [Candidatus Dormibacteraeota bacterium]|nr:hypothetical protein [Candidatus Dormibacteraeota bacterium]